MTRAEKLEYIQEYIRATDDGTFETEDDLLGFVIDQLYDEFGEDLSDLAVQAREDMH